MRGQCVGMSCLSVGRACRMEELELHHCRKVYDWQPRKYEPETLRLWRVFSRKAAREFFRCGVRNFSLPRQNRKVLAPHFQEGQKRKFPRVNSSDRGWCSLHILLVGGMSVGCLCLWSFFRSNRRGLSSSIIDTIIVWILRLTERGSADPIPKEKERGDPSPMMELWSLPEAERDSDRMETFARRLAYILLVNSLYNRELFCIFEY